LLRWTVTLTFAGLAAPAAAQMAVEVGLQSDYRHRGFSLTDEEPVASVAMTYDDPSGTYFGASVVGTVEDGEPKLVSVQGTLGYAKRLSPDISIDGGVTRTQYGSYVFGQETHYTEFYLGFATRNVATRVRYSPDYYRSNWETLYVEVDGGMEVAPDWLLSAHAGQLTYLGERSRYMVRSSYDWRVGGTRRIGLYGIHLDLSGRLAKLPPALVAPGDANRLRTTQTAVVLGVTRAF